MSGARGGILGLVLGLIILAAGCGGLYAPLGENPGRLELVAQGSIDQKDINQAVFEQVGSLQDQPTLWHWLGLPTWQVQGYLLGEAAAIWPLKPLGGLANPLVGMEADGVASFAVPAGTHRYRLTFSCVVTHYWDEGGTWQEPVYVYLRQKEMEITVAPGQTLRISHFGQEKGK